MSVRIGIAADFIEEGWPSMDLCDAMLRRYLPVLTGWETESVCPPFSRFASRLPIIGAGSRTQLIERLANRWLLYPRSVGRYRHRCDLFHIVDHSYAHLVHRLPPERTGVYCHDLDAFRCLLNPKLEPRPAWFKKMSKTVLNGLEKASVVFFSTHAVHAEILRFQLLDPAKLFHAPYGVDEVFQPNFSPEPSMVLKGLDGVPWLLHVGATIPRKRIDILLDVFAQARAKIPELMLGKVGSDWSAEQRQQIERMDLAKSIRHLGRVPLDTLVDAYQRTTAVLITSDAEGFGLPVIEAMACGAPVIASDIPVLRESGGNGALFAPVGDIEAWVNSVERVLRNDASIPNRETRLSWASQFSWKKHAQIIADAYKRLL